MAGIAVAVSLGLRLLAVFAERRGRQRVQIALGRRDGDLSAPGEDPPTVL